MVEEPSSQTPNGVHLDENGNEGGSNEDDLNVRGQEELLLPFANIGQIMKKALTAKAKIAKDSKEMMQFCVTEFIGFVTDEANKKCKGENRKTVNGNDLLWAMKSLGFENYLEPLKIYLDKYREFEGGNQGSTTNEPGDANSGNKEEVAPPISPVVQTGHASVYVSGMPYMPPQMPQTMGLHGHGVNMPPPMTNYGNNGGVGPQISPIVQTGHASGYGGRVPYMPPQMPDGYQINMPPPMTAPGNYQSAMPSPMTAPGNYQSAMPPPMTMPGNYQFDMPPPMTAPGNYQFRMPPQNMAPNNYSSNYQSGSRFDG